MHTIQVTVQALRRKTVFNLFTWFTRILLAIAFFPSGLKKLMSERFTFLGIESPVGFFFEALYQTGWYWNFLGFMQLLAALLLLIPRTTFFGAIIYLPLVINIFAIVTSMHFVGTPYIAGLMLLANFYLLMWDYEKLSKTITTIFQKY